MRKSSHYITLFILIFILIFGCNKTKTPSTPGDVQPTATITYTFTATSSATATATATPVTGTVTGSIILPSDKSGWEYTVFIDSDLNTANGIINRIIGVCNSSLAIPYSMTATSGTFYVYGAVLSDPSKGPRLNDLAGVYGTTFPVFPVSPNVNVITGSVTSGVDINMAAITNNVSGTITLPAPVTAKAYVVILDTDMNPSNGYYSADTGLVSGSSRNYALAAVLPLDYYIYALVDRDSSGLETGATSGDYYGYYSMSAVHIEPAVGLSGANFILGIVP